MQTYEVETFKQIWHCDGWSVRIGPDPDGLDSVEIKYIEDPRDNKYNISLVVDQKMALLIAKAINDLYGDKNEV